MAESLADKVASLTPEEYAKVFEGWTEEQFEALKYDANFWLRPEQKIPDGDWYITALVAGRGFGKGATLSTLIPTMDGWKKMGDMQAGDTVFDENGAPCKVIAAHDPYTPTRLYRITFSDGNTVEVDGDHLWTTWTHKDFKRFYYEKRCNPNQDKAVFPHDWAVRGNNAVHVRNVKMTAEEWLTILAKLSSGKSDRAVATEHGISRGFIRKYRNNPQIVLDSLEARPKSTDVLHSSQTDRHFIPRTKPVQFSEKALPIEPWTMGILLGDGHTLTGQNIAVHPDDKAWLLDKLEERGNVVARGSHLKYPDKCSILNTGVAWKSLSLNLGKYIPDTYLTSSVEQRLELLRGLIDSDGHVSSDGHYRFYNTNLRLIQGVIHLVESLGMRATVSEKEGSESTRYKSKTKTAYTVIFNSQGLVCCSLPRKSERHREIHTLTNSAHEIVSVEEIPVEQVRCLTVDSSSHLYLITESFLPTHNTLAVSQWIRKKAMEQPGIRIGIAGRTVADVRNVMVNGESGILNISPDSERPEYKAHVAMLYWPNGSQAELLSSEAPDSARGRQYHVSVGDEFAAWKTTVDSSGATLFSNLIAATRLGDNPQLLLATTPKRTQVMKELMERSNNPAERVRIVRGSTFDNTSLSKLYIENLARQYGNSDLAKQELYGQMLDDAEGLVFTQQMLKDAAVSFAPKLPLRFIAVDPSVAEKPRDECGIVAVGCTAERDIRRRTAYILEDYSLRAAPDVWAKQVVDAAREHNTKFIVAERNQGGALIQMAINAVDPSLKVFTVVATKGKQLRAEPVVMTMQQNRVKMVGSMRDLEDQMLFYDPEDSGYSPDRMDAMVWGVTAALISPPDGLRFSSYSTMSAASRRLPTGIGTGRQRGHFRADRGTLGRSF